MTSSTEPRLGGRVRLPVVMVVALIGAVCAGILAMHHLAGGGHAASHMSATAPAHSTPADRDMPAMRMLTATEPAAAEQSDPGASAPRLMTSEGPEAATAACILALLTGLVVLAAHSGGSWWARRESSQTLLQVRTGGPRPGRGPPRDLLAQLCVLRT